jgi:hypothetical protein
MTQETTQLQKAIVIAKKDNYVNTHDFGGWYEHKFYTDGKGEDLLMFYTTDLNYLMPIAVKVLKESSCMNKEYWDLQEAYMDIKLDNNNQYTELFDALFNAIKLLEND